MHPLDVPHFKEIIIMATTCDECGFKSSEVKSGAAISAHGKRIIFSLQNMEDLSRDILKSETCSVSIPEIGLELHQGTLGGRFTTVEGLLSQVKQEMEERVLPFALGDSASPEKASRFKDLLGRLEAIVAGESRCTIVIDDPLSNSHLQNLCAPDADPQIVVEEYVRTQEQNDDLGITDMVV